MLVIESGVVVTIIATAVSIVLTSLVTWYVARRHYGGARPPNTTSIDVELERVRLEARNEALGGVGGIVTILAVILLFPILILTLECTK